MTHTHAIHKNEKEAILMSKRVAEKQKTSAIESFRKMETSQTKPKIIIVHKKQSTEDVAHSESNKQSDNSIPKVNLSVLQNHNGNGFKYIKPSEPLSNLKTKPIASQSDDSTEDKNDGQIRLKHKLKTKNRFKTKQIKPKQLKLIRGKLSKKNKPILPSSGKSSVIMKKQQNITVASSKAKLDSINDQEKMLSTKKATNKRRNKSLLHKKRLMSPLARESPQHAFSDGGSPRNRT